MSRCLCCCGNRPGSASKITNAVASAECEGRMTYSKLTDEDRKLVKESSEIIFNKMHLENKGVQFLIGFFKQHPHHQKSFKAFRNITPDELNNLPKANNHGRKVMDQIALLVVHIEEPEAMQSQLLGLRERHRKRRVHVRQLRDMLMGFVDFVRKEMGHRFTEPVGQAWSRLILTVVGILEEGEDEPPEGWAADGEDYGATDLNANADDDHERLSEEKRPNGIQQAEVPVESNDCSEPATNLSEVTVKVISCDGDKVVSGDVDKVISGDVDKVTSGNGDKVISGNDDKVISDDGPKVISDDGDKVISGDVDEVISSDGGKVISDECPKVISDEYPKVISDDGDEVDVVESTATMNDDSKNNHNVPPVSDDISSPEIVRM